MSNRDYDYSVYYSRFHGDSEAEADRATNDALHSLSEYLPSDRGARILDVGCGFGFALRACRRVGFSNLAGLEVSEQQAARARRAGLNIELTDDPAAWISSRPGEFDCVLLLDVIEHVPVENQIQLLRTIYASLRPGGRLILTTPNANSILFGRWRYNDYTHHASFTEHSLYFILKNAGFDTVQIDATKGLERFPRALWRRSARQALRKWIVRWCWLQVFKAEIPWEKLDQISFELNLKALALKS